MTREVERVPRDELDISRRELMAGTSAVATGSVLGMSPSEVAAMQSVDNFIRGTVTEGGSGVQDATVVAVPHDSTLDPLVTSTDSSGDYAFEEADLHGGENLYHVIARDGSESDPKRGQENYPFIRAKGDNVPPDKNDLQGWYSAKDISASDGDAVSTWPDNTDNNNDLTAGTSPTYVSSGINGNPVVRFDGTDDFLDVTWGSSISTPATYFVVAKKRSTSDSNDSIFDGISSGNRHHLWATTNTNSNEWRIFAGTTLQSGVSSDTNANIHSELFDGTSSIMRLNGSQIASGDSGTETATGLTVGTRHDQTAAGDYDVGEILVYPMDKSGIFSDAEQYLDDEWGPIL